MLVPKTPETHTPKTLLEHVDFLRIDASRQLDASRRAEMGQFFTPPNVARLMVSMISKREQSLSILDAGAGVGSLSAACVAELCEWKHKPATVTVTAYEIEPLLIDYLQDTLDECSKTCAQAGIKFESEIILKDFIAASVAILRDRALLGMPRSFNVAILNPPYRDISSGSDTPRQLRTVRIDTGNLYTAFLWLIVKLLDPGGELVAIVPRSFCNGTYFRPFRLAFLNSMSLKRIHIYESRDKAFEEEEVLQENIILHAIKSSDHTGKVTISSSTAPGDDAITVHEVEYGQLVHPDDEDAFIHIVPDELAAQFKEQMDTFTCSLEDLRLSVSTGRVVDFRATNFLRKRPRNGTVPLIYPTHFSKGYITWPVRNKKKYQAILAAKKTDALLVRNAYYVLVKRFSAKEERRRVVAVVYDPKRVSTDRVGFENHLNYYHRNSDGLPPDLAKGLAAFLNTTLVDQYFRQFSGHTQVNANDLRRIKYPNEASLIALGTKIGNTFPDQNELDQVVGGELNLTANDKKPDAQDPTQATQKIGEALNILQALNLPRAQRNDRSALTLLSLLDVKPNDSWDKAAAPLRGITEMMDYIRDHYGRRYAPNTRETVRRQTVHQFQQAGLIMINPDAPNRPINSPKTRYQIEPAALKLIQTYGTTEWDTQLKSFLETADQLKQLRTKECQMTLIPVKLPDGREINLSGGGQNVLIKSIIEEFCPRFTPGGTVVEIGDAREKLNIDKPTYLRALGIEIDKHGKMPDVIVHYTKRNWLVLIEAVTSHGPIDIKRHNELKELFKASKAGLVFVTAFETRRVMAKYLSQIAWETDVWAAESPSHIVHFNGERFLGPYE